MLEREKKKKLHKSFSQQFNEKYVLINSSDHAQEC